MERALGILRTAIAVLLGLAIAAAAALHLEPGAGDLVVPSPTDDTTPARVVPREGQAFVRGTVTRLVARGAVPAEALALPLTLEPAVRGEGGARIEGVTVAGERAAVVWDGGRPLVVEGDGGLDVGPVDLEVGASSVTWLLDGDARVLQRGSYRTPTAVAVGREGLAQPREGVEFAVDREATVETHGGVRTVTAPATLRLEGPGAVTVEGTLEVETSDGTRTATTVEAAEGPFVVTLTRSSSGYSIDAVLQSSITVR